MYYYLLIVFVVLSLFLSSTFPRYENIIFYTNMFLLFMFAALRGNGDVDYFKYKEYTELFTNLRVVLFEKSFIEIGFRVLSYINNILNLNPQFVIVIMNLISISSITFVFGKMSINKMLSVFLFLPFFFQLDMHSARTAVASSLGLLSIFYLKDKRVIKYIAVVLLAMSFHKTAAVLFIPLGLLYIPNNEWVNNIRLTKSIGIAWLMKHFISLTSMLILFLKMLHLNRLSNKVISYSQSQFGKPFSLFDPRVILAALIYVVFSYTIRQKRKKNENIDLTTEILLFFSLFTVVLFILFSDMTILAVRITYFFNIASCISVPIIFKEVDRAEGEKVLDIKISRALLNLSKVSFFFLYIIYIVVVLPKVPYYLFF